MIAILVSSYMTALVWLIIKVKDAPLMEEHI